MRSVLDRIGFGLILTAVLLGSAELFARVEDLARRDTPILAGPADILDLVIIDSLGARGRPGGQYKWLRLNRFGFRGPEMSQKPAPNCVRVMVLGASETLGILESDTKQYPAQLQDSLELRAGCYEVVNAGMPGLTLRGIIQLWTNWGFHFAPQIVVVYPTPSFYLAETPPIFRVAPRKDEVANSTWFTPRIWARAKDALAYPKFIQRRRVARAIAERERGRSPDWFFRSIPQDRLEQFRADLDSLLRSIVAIGAQPIVLTHAIRFSVPPHPDDADLLNSWRAFSVRPTIDVLLAFEEAARQSVIDVGMMHRVAIIDASAVMSGQRVWFGDAQHFTDTGAGVLAGLIAEGVERVARSGNQMPTASGEASTQSN